MTEVNHSAIDESHPWPGLESFREGDASHFFGRSKEIDELMHRVERQVLTVLFSHSGLGKTSLLRAGLFPALRRDAFLPIYVRLDHSPEADSLVEQIWDTLDRHLKLEAPYDGGGAARAHTLWEWFHDTRSGLLSDHLSGVTPVFVFDQFEELFTLGASYPERMGQRAEFLTQLSDLIENRVPESLERRLETGGGEEGEYDYDTTSYRILLALRDDYLSQLERERTLIPSLMQNRMSLNRLKGEQAMTVVTKPGGKLVDEAVAEKIVRFVGGEEERALSEFDVEPALLSLVCRELNRERIDRGHDQISADLLRGSRASILEHYYEECFEGLASNAKAFVEDELLTDTGHRESMTVERARKMIGQEAIQHLVDARLLHTEQRGNLPRIELTHDVLTGMVARSRDKRREVEMREEAEREKRRAREREKQARRARARSGIIALAMAILAMATLWQSRAAKKKQLEAERAKDLAGIALERIRGDYRSIAKLDRYNDQAKKASSDLDQYNRQSAQTNEAKITQLIYRANFNHVEGDFEGAAARYREALSLAEGDEANLGRLARVCERLSGVLLELNELEEARESQARAVEIRKELADRGSDGRWKAMLMSDLVSSHRMLASIEFEAGHLDKSKEHYGQAIAILTALRGEEPENTSVLGPLGRAHMELGDVMRSQGEFTGAVEGYREGAALLEKAMSRAPLDFLLPEYMADCQKGWGLALVGTRSYGAAVERLREAVRMYEETWSYEPQATHALAVSYVSLGEALRLLGTTGGGAEDLAEAKEYYGKGLRAIDPLLSLPVATAGLRKDAKAGHEGYATLLELLGEAEEAAKEREVAERLGRGE